MLHKRSFYALISILMLASMVASCAKTTAEPNTQVPVVPETQAPVAALTEAPTTIPTQAPVPTETATPGGGILSVGIATEPETLDPGDAVYIPEQFVLISLFDSLLSMAPDNSLHPGLALSWEPNAAYNEFTFQLRQDVTFHDGTPFTAEAVKASFDHIKNDVLTSGGKDLLDSHGYVETVVVGEYSATVKFNAPYPTFLRDAARQWLSISSPAALQQYGSEYGRHPVGTGPFRFVRWDIQSQIVVERNPDYAWAPEFTHPGPAYLEQIVYRILPDAATRLTALQTGEILVAEEPPALDALDLVDQGLAVVKTFTSPGLPSHQMINTTKAPTDDINVRKAMILSVNQEELVQTAFRSLGVPAHSIVSPTTWSYNPAAAELYKYDPVEAARLLEESDWKDTNNDGIREKEGQNLHIRYLSIPSWEEAFNELLAGYLQATGFEVEMVIVDDAGAVSEALAGNFNMINMGWVKADPSPMRILFDSANIDGGMAYTHFNNPDLDRLLADADSQTDETIRAKDYEDAQMIVMENALVIPLFCYNRVYLMTSTVQNFSFDMEGYPFLYDVSLAP